jgi:hypothetical protein
MAVAVEAPFGEASGPHEVPHHRRVWRTVGRSGWVPAALVATLTAYVLHAYGVAFPTTLTFAGYIGAGVILPGTLLWRAGHGRSGWFLADVAAGTAVGYAMETLTYLVVRALGVPLLVLIFPAAAIVTFLAVPRLRPYWRGCGDRDDRAPAWFAWAMGLLLVVLVLRSTRLFRSLLLQWPYVSASDPDPAFHLAIIGDAKYHIPPVTPWVAGEPMLYHWFVYPEMAATSWVTGISPMVLLFRLSLLPMIFAFVALIAAMARRLTGRWWPGLVASAASFLVLSANPLPWRLPDSWYGFDAFDDGSLFNMVTWTSPTQTFGMLLFAGAMLVLIELQLDEARPGRATFGRWALFTVLLAVLTGAKATFLPLLLAALVCQLAVLGVARRRLHRPTAVAAAICAVGLAFAQLVLYRGANLGLTVAPLAAERLFSAMVPAVTGLTDQGAPLRRVLFATGLNLLCLAFIWGGILGLLIRRRFLNPAVLLLLTVGASGLSLFLLLGHSGGAQGYFISSARPYLTIAAVLGLVTLLDTAALPRRAGLAIVSALGAGVGAVYVVRLFGDTHMPTQLDNTASHRATAMGIAQPYAVLVALVAVAGTLGWLALRGRRAFGLAMIVALGAGFGLPTVADNAAFMIDNGTRDGWMRDPDRAYFAVGDTTGASAMIRDDVQRAGAWLRDHSSPGDLVATNAHCLWAASTDAPCDNRHFSIAAVSERRILVEGWGFVDKAYVTAAAAGVDPSYGPFWDQNLLATNDAAFTHPSTATVARLRDSYGVRWLFADEAQGNVAADLGTFATLRFRTGRVGVYELSP